MNSEMNNWFLSSYKELCPKNVHHSVCLTATSSSPQTASLSSGSILHCLNAYDTDTKETLSY